jgi:uncharacterized membrane protein
MAEAVDGVLYRPMHPLRAIVLAFPLPLFVGALLADLAYYSTYHIQWSNFAAWLIVGGLVGGGFALLWAAVAWVRGRRARRARPLVHVLLLLAMFALGFVNALVHAKDAWAVMPDGLILSALVAVLALAATWTGHSAPRDGAAT